MDVVHGSMLMADLEKMISVGGYDERVFLYGEENLLRLENAGHGLENGSAAYPHLFSPEFRYDFQNLPECEPQAAAPPRKCHLFYRHYLHINKIQLLFTRVFHEIVMFEIWFCGNVLHMTW